MLPSSLDRDAFSSGSSEAMVAPNWSTCGSGTHELFVEDVPVVVEK
jgi:hypothetical protein